MGLDMYLNKKTYIGANFEHRKVKGKVEITIGEKRQKVNIKFNRLSEISEHVGYWRKANAIHAWFVREVQNGVDECQEANVPLKKLEELLAICVKIVKNKSAKVADKLLPPQSGFFFGNTAIDDWYYNDLKNTIKILRPLIKEIKAEQKLGTYPEVFYQSSW
jgi:hypothetical protein